MTHPYAFYQQEFLNWLQNEKGSSAHTIRAYQEDLAQFGEYLKAQRIPLEQLEYHDLRYYMASLQQKQQLKKTTLSRKTSTLKSFCKFLHREGMLEHNPADLLSTPKKEKRLPTVINEVDMTAFLDDFLAGEEPLQLRNKAIFELLYSSGLRVSELVQLDVENVQKQKGMLRILGKGSKERIVPVGERAQFAIAYYLEHGRPLLVKEEVQALFLNRQGKRLTTRGVEYILEQYVKQGALKYKVTPHAFRHSFATHLLQNGADLKAIQTMLGHSDISSTQVYMQFQDEGIKNVYKKAHPRA